jgi:hypothetical protein
MILPRRDKKKTKIEQTLTLFKRNYNLRKMEDKFGKNSWKRQKNIAHYFQCGAYMLWWSWGGAYPYEIGRRNGFVRLYDSEQFAMSGRGGRDAGA